MITVQWLRHRRRARRYNPKREWSEFHALRAAEVALTSLDQYKRHLEAREAGGKVRRA